MPDTFSPAAHDSRGGPHRKPVKVRRGPATVRGPTSGEFIRRSEAGPLINATEGLFPWEGERRSLEPGDRPLRARMQPFEGGGGGNLLGPSGSARPVPHDKGDGPTCFIQLDLCARILRG
jgi:hypothetical protein